MLSVLFWNVQKKPLLDRVARLVRAHAVDVVVLAECAQTDAELLASLNGGGGKQFVTPPRGENRLRVATALPASQFAGVFTDTSRRLIVYEYRPTTGDPILLAGVHLPSQQSPSPYVIGRVAAELRECERGQGHDRTFVVGDFNCSPFDDVMVNALGFHALMTRELAVRQHRRTVQGEEYPTFYNPMWQFLADRAGRPPGTYYRHASVELNHFWYALDQVLVRPALADKLRAVEILETDGTDRLAVPRGWPDESTASDHLPLLFRLDW